MTKIADTSFFGPMPTFRPTRNCFGLLSNQTLYFIFKLLSLPHFAFLILMCIPSLRPPWFWWKFDYEIVWQAVLMSTCAVCTVFWLISIALSLVGYAEKISYLHVPLGVLETIFMLISISLCAAFTWALSFQASTNEQRNGDLQKALLFLYLSVYHGYYTMILYYEWMDCRKKKEMEEFVARQKMIDDVCEEMLMEEQEEEERAAYRYAELNHSRRHHHQHPQQYSQYPPHLYPSPPSRDDCSLYSQSDYSISISSSELRMMYNRSLQNARHISYYDEDGTIYI